MKGEVEYEGFKWQVFDRSVAELASRLGREFSSSIG